MPSPAVLDRLSNAKGEFERLKAGKDALLRLLDESEVPEFVYNSNAIENSTLSLEDTERILLSVEISRHMDLREVHEAQNLARVTDYIRRHFDHPFDLERVLLLHRMLLANIDEPIAGRFRKQGEYVRVGTHVAPAPEQVNALLSEMFVRFESDLSSRVTQRIAHLHLEFERIHPFNDGNGRIGRVLVNYALYRAGFPPIIIRNKGKDQYYAMLRRFDSNGDTKPFEDHLVLLMLESLHRRNAYLGSRSTVLAADEARSQGIKTNAFLNQARRQLIPAFRERGVWKIAEPESNDG
jgi:Fic family protein